MHPSHKVSALPGDGQVVRSNLKARIAVASVTGAVLATGVLIWVSYGLARGSGFGGRSSDWGTVAAWAGGIATSLAAWVAPLVAAEVFDTFRAPSCRSPSSTPGRGAAPGNTASGEGGSGAENIGRGPPYGCMGRITGLAPHRGDHHLANTARC